MGRPWRDKRRDGGRGPPTRSRSDVQRLSADAENLNWLVSSFARRVPAVTSALVVSADGLLLAMSEGVDRSIGDQLSAVVSGLASLGQAASRCLHGKPVRQMIAEMEDE